MEKLIVRESSNILGVDFYFNSVNDFKKSFISLLNKEEFYPFIINYYPEELTEKNLEEVKKLIKDGCFSDNYLEECRKNINKSLNEIADFINENRNVKEIKNFVFINYPAVTIIYALLNIDSDFWLNISIENNNLLEYSMKIEFEKDMYLIHADVSDVFSEKEFDIFFEYDEMLCRNVGIILLELGFSINSKYVDLAHFISQNSLYDDDIADRLFEMDLNPNQDLEAIKEELNELNEDSLDWHDEDDDDFYDEDDFWSTSEEF